MDSSWKIKLKDTLESDWFKKLETTINEQRQQKTIYPDNEDVFRALTLPFDDVKIVILGQDPYHGHNQAHGLSFSVKEGVKIPPSLQNIFKEACVEKENGDLSGWLDQGVLLLNTVLTVEAGKPKSHANLGWQKLTMYILQLLVEEKDDIVFMLWGRDAQSVSAKVNFKNTHLVLKAAHPSPLGAHYHAPVPFYECKHFKKANEYLLEHHKKEIDWNI